MSRYIITYGRKPFGNRLRAASREVSDLKQSQAIKKATLHIHVCELVSF